MTCVYTYMDNQERLADIQHTATIQDDFSVTSNHKIDQEITQYTVFTSEPVPETTHTHTDINYRHIASTSYFSRLS